MERDIMAQMDFRPAVSPLLKLMDARIYLDAPMGLRDEMLLPVRQAILESRPQ
jgi:propionate CoA-transferase